MSSDPVIDEPLVLPFILALARTNDMAGGRMARLRRSGATALPISEVTESASQPAALIDPV
jgi:hypothetical protein